MKNANRGSTKIPKFRAETLLKSKETKKTIQISAKRQKSIGANLRRQKQNAGNLDEIFFNLLQGVGVPRPVQEYKFHPVRKWRFDYAFPEKKLALECEGGVYIRGRHVTPTGFIKDMEKYNTAALMGWRVFRFMPSEMNKKSLIENIRKFYFAECEKLQNNTLFE